MLNLFQAGEFGLIKTVEIQLEAFGFHQVKAGMIQLNLAYRHLRQTASIQPGELIQRPDITADKRQRVCTQP